MTSSNNLLAIVGALVAAAAVFVSFVGQALGIRGFPWIVAIALGVPTAIAGAVHFRSVSAGRWWLSAVVTFALTFVLFAVVGLLSTSNSTDL